MQGHDSVEIRADVSWGGSEQLFRLDGAAAIAARRGQEPAMCADAATILAGLDRRTPHGKSLGNYIALASRLTISSPKTMSVPERPDARMVFEAVDRPAG